MDIEGAADMEPTTTTTTTVGTDLTPAGKNLCQILFGLVDIEGGGSVDLANLFQMVTQLTGMQATDEDKTRFIQRYSDGLTSEIKLPQFEQIIKNLVTSDEVRKSATAIMPLVDKNADGFVDESDLQEVYEMLGLPNVDSMPLIRSFDMDADGKLNAEEFGNLIADSLKMLFSSNSETELTPLTVDEADVA